MRTGERGGDGLTRLAPQAARSWSQRFSLSVLFLLAIVLMLLGKADAVIVDKVSQVVQDVVTPAVELAGVPARLIGTATEDLSRLTELRAENEKLRSENAALRQSDLAAETLRAENALLRQLLAFAPEPMVGFATARVVADQGGSFVRNFLLNAGARQSIRRNHVVVGASGLVGRVVETGEWSARVLLITDLNSRVPVLVENSRWRAVLAGDNSDSPRLLYLSESAAVAPGERVITSGHGGVFPPGLPVGEVEAVTDGTVRVRPYEDFDRIEFVRVVNFGLEAFDRRLSEQAVPAESDGATPAKPAGEEGAGPQAGAADGPAAAPVVAVDGSGAARTAASGGGAGGENAAAAAAGARAEGPALPVPPQRRPAPRPSAAATADGR